LRIFTPNKKENKKGVREIGLLKRGNKPFWLADDGVFLANRIDISRERIVVSSRGLGQKGIMEKFESFDSIMEHLKCENLVFKLICI